MNEIFPMRYGMKGNLLEDYYKDVVLDEEGLFPRDLMPFAQDPGGDFFCFRPGGSKKGSICYWRHEYPDPPEKATVDLADDLESFLSSLI